jgi:hypothetical protein
VIDLRWSAVAVEALGVVWPWIALFAGAQTLLLRRMRQGEGQWVAVPAVGGTLVSWLVATGLYTAQLGSDIAGFAARHAWALGVAASVAGFGFTTAAWFWATKAAAPRQGRHSA